MKLHVDEKPYQCSFCDKAFVDISALTVHNKLRDNHSLKHVINI